MSTFKKAICVSNNYSGLKSSTLHVLAKLWDSDIRSDIFIFGDSDLNPCDVHMADELDKLRSKVYDRFISFLIDNDYIEHEEKIKEKWFLVSSKEYDGQVIDFDIVKNKQGLLDRHKECIKLWKGIQSYDTYSCQKEKYDSLTQKLCDDLCDGLDDNSVIILDLWFLDGDFAKLIPVMNSNIDMPLLSMGLYNALKRKDKYNVFLYSSLVVYDEFIKRWIRTYTRMYDESRAIPKDEVTIYTRYGRDFANLSSNERLHDKIIGILA